MKLRHFLRTLVLAIAPAILAPAPGFAQTGPPPVSAADLQQAARIALAQGVVFLRKRAEKDPEGWIIPPGRPNRVIDWKEVVVKYREVEVEVEVPIFEYKEVITFQQASAGEPPKKVVTQVPSKKIGSRKVKQMSLQGDPEGPIERKHRIPIYDKGGNTFWYASTIGDAAMAVCALRRAGVPESDQVIQRMLANFGSYLAIYGPPDQTWNLAWLIAALAPNNGKDAIKWTQILTGRLLDGQITDGPARGLWGPMSFHPRLLSVLTRDYLAITAEIQKREAKVKKAKTKANEVSLEEAKFALTKQQEIVEGWLRRGLRFGHVELPFPWEVNADPSVTFAGSSDFIYNQRSADIESTWVALHALAAAAENQRLPQQSLRPTLRKLPSSPAGIGTVIVPPETPMAVLARAANALAALQAAGGRWTECNFHQPVTDFDTFTSVLPVPADPKSFPPLASPITPASAAQGIAALGSIGRAVGMDKLGRFQRNFSAGALGRKTEVQSLIKTAWPSPAKRPVLAPASYDLFLVPTRVPPGDPGAAQLEDQLTQLLILAGNPAGGWGTGTSRSFIPSSSRERHAALKDLPNRIWSSVIELNKAHAYVHNVTGSGHIVRDAEGFATAAAVYYLGGRVEKPDASLLLLEPDPTLPELRKDADLALMGKAPVPTIRATPPPVPPTPATTAATSPAVPVKPPVTPAVPPPPKEPDPDAAVPVIPAKPADTKPKKDESF